MYIVHTIFLQGEKLYLTRNTLFIIQQILWHWERLTNLTVEWKHKKQRQLMTCDFFQELKAILFLYNIQLKIKSLKKIKFYFLIKIDEFIKYIAQCLPAWVDAPKERIWIFWWVIRQGFNQFYYLNKCKVSNAAEFVFVNPLSKNDLWFKWQIFYFERN